MRVPSRYVAGRAADVRAPKGAESTQFYRSGRIRGDVWPGSPSGTPCGMADEWPSIVWLLRHGQSAGNVARDAAEAGGLARIDIAQRDMDVPLSELGERQAAAVARWFAGRPADERPTAYLSSPYVRAVEPARIVREGAGGAGEIDVDERLREREFGVLDRLTRGHHRAPPGAGRVPAVFWEVLPPAAGRRELVLTSGCACGRCSTSCAATTPATACSS